MNLDEFKQWFAADKAKIQAEIDKAEKLNACLQELNKDLTDYHFAINIKNTTLPGEQTVLTQVNFINNKSGRSSPVITDNCFVKDEVSLENLKQLAANLRWWDDSIWFGETWHGDYSFTNNPARYLVHRNCLLVGGDVYVVDLKQLLTTDFATLDEFLATAEAVYQCPVKLPALATPFRIEVAENKIIRVAGDLPAALADLEATLPAPWNELVHQGWRVDFKKAEKAQAVIDKYPQIWALKDDLTAMSKCLTKKNTKTLK